MCTWIDFGLTYIMYGIYVESIYVFYGKINFIVETVWQLHEQVIVCFWRCAWRMKTKREREKKECLYNFDLKIMSLSNREIEWKLEFRCNASGLKCHYDFKMDSRMPKPHCAQSFTVPSGCCKISGMNVFLHSWMNRGLVKLLYSSF